MSFLNKEVDIFVAGKYKYSGIVVEDGGINLGMSENKKGSHYKQCLVRNSDGKHFWANYCNIRLQVFNRSLLVEINRIGKEIEKTVQELYKVSGVE